MINLFEKRLLWSCRALLTVPVCVSRAAAEQTGDGEQLDTPLSNAVHKNEVEVYLLHIS